MSYVWACAEEPNYECIRCKLYELLEEKVKGLEAILATLKLNEQNEKPQPKQEDWTKIKHNTEQTAFKKITYIYESKEENWYTHTEHSREQTASIKMALYMNLKWKNNRNITFFKKKRVKPLLST